MKFVIRERLPGLNEYSNAERNNRYGANNFKRAVEMKILRYIQEAKIKKQIKPVAKRQIFRFTWVEQNGKRDVDNIAFAKKFIFDALQTAKILPNDNQKWVAGFEDRFVVDKKAKVIVEMEDFYDS